MRWLLLLLCVGCRIEWSAWQGAPPRAANAVTLALYAPDDSTASVARAVLARDSHVTVVDFDRRLIESEKASCGTASCSSALAAACAWAVSHGIEYYAIGAVSTAYSAKFVCTKRESLGLLDKNEPPCVEGHETDQSTRASFTLDIYDAKTCTLVPALSHEVTAVAAGPAEDSQPEALHELGVEAPAKSIGLPDQVNISPSGGLIGEDARDGFYAVYRGGAYLGGVEVRGLGTPDERVTPLRCCFTPGPGDVLVARGRTRYLELAFGGAGGFITFDGDREPAAGAGLHVRYFPLDGGLRFGAGADALASTDASVYVVTGEVGWGIRPHPAWHVSANLGVGFAVAQQEIAAMPDWAPMSVSGQLQASLRAQLQLAGWWYLATDVGYLHSGTFDSWEGDGFAMARPMAIRSPLVRVYAGVDL